ncbi:MAG: metallophosphoesterase family protein [Desulfovibrio sp.]
MKKIAIISDTHMSSIEPWFEKAYSNVLSQADYIFHCGDHTSADVHHYLLQHERLLAARGNCDWGDGLGELPQVATATIEGFKIAVTHGWGDRPGVPGRLTQSFSSDEFDIVCYGHTHTRNWVEANGMYLLNPGSFGEETHSYAILTLEEGEGPEVVFKSYQE